jgi:hypothetical protein
MIRNLLLVKFVTELERGLPVWTGPDVAAVGARRVRQVVLAVQIHSGVLGSLQVDHTKSNPTWTAWTLQYSASNIIYVIFVFSSVMQGTLVLHAAYAVSFSITAPADRSASAATRSAVIS